MIHAANEEDRLAHSHLNRVVMTGGAISDAHSQAFRIFMRSIAADIGIAKFHAIYPYVGATAASHALDAMGGFDLTWVGGLTHDSNGTTGNGTTGYAKTGITPSTHLSLNDVGLTIYNRTATSPATMIDFSAHDGTDLLVFQIRRSDDQVIFHSNNATPISTTTGSSAKAGGYTALRRGAADVEIYKNGVSIQTGTPAPVALPSQELWLWCYNPSGSPTLYSDTNACMHAVHTALTDGEALALYNAIQTLQTALGRNI